MTTSTGRQPSTATRSPSSAQPPTATRAVDGPAAGHPLAVGPALSRVAGLPAAAVAPLAAEEVAEVLDRIAAARRELAALAPAVTGLLHDAVPLMPTTGARRSVLRWRRAAHAGRPDLVPPELLAQVREALATREAREVSALERWVERAGSLAELRQLLGRRAGAAEAAEERTLRHLMGLPAVSGALALVSPVFSRRVRQPGGRPLDRGERLTAYGYAVRSALKASPLSSLTHVSVPGADHGARVRVVLHPLVGRVLLRAAAVRHGVRDLVRWRVNGSLRVADPLARMSEPRQSVTDGWAWSDDEVLDATGREDLFAALRDPGRLPAVRLARYLEAGLLDIDDPCPQDGLLDWLATALAASRDPSDLRAAGRLRTAAGELAVIAGGGPAARADALVRLREALEDALGALGAADDWPLDDVTLVYEDRAGTLPARPLDDERAALLRRHAGAVCDSLRVSPEYQALTDAFVARFGPGGVCDDVFGFFQELAAFGIPGAPGAPFGPAPGTARPARPGRSSCLPSVAVVFQDCDADGDGPLLVVNQVSSGAGGLVARFHRLYDSVGDAPGAGFAERLRAWVRTLHPDAECLEFVPAREVNPLQGDSCGVLPASLHWPTVPRRFGPGVPVEELVLVHDGRRNALELRRRSGTPVAPVYLGTVPRHLVGGAARFLLVLADPWWLPPGLADGTRPDGQPGAGRGASARHVVAGAAVRRAHWRWETSEVPRREPGEEPAVFLERVDAWRRAHGMPAEVYVRGGSGSPRRGDRARKPLWLSFASPTGLDLLDRLTERPGTVLVFAECLPRRPVGEGPDAHVVEHCVHFARPVRDTEPERCRDGR
ncbi:hypothetical protein [Streptomyces sp. WMMC940]|uniref:hypothetical protein n=1 Tax=Streptomyces sp. WMMC940 TaxID=3015153 RepID=UPI0022B6182F|nr:hypothetical protein [Streptomyces sp. WMMC940]MCZ7459967.1 hypothetical protein [Streptomyces sp. WMMC940]